MRLPSFSMMIYWFKKEDYYRLKILLLCIFIFFFSISFRHMFSLWFNKNHNLEPYISPEGYYWETYDDASYYYVNYLNAFKNGSWIPYTPELERPLGGYYYGPVFVYILVLGSYFISIAYPNRSPINIAWKTVRFLPSFFDSLTTVLIFLIILNKSTKKHQKSYSIVIAFLSALIYIFMPLVVFYNDILFLNTYLFTFFTILAYYFLITDKIKLSSIFLAVAFMSKQLALFFFPLWLIYIYRNNRKRSLEFFCYFVLTSFVFVIPWIFMNPVWFMGSLFAPGVAQHHIRFSIDWLQVYFPTSLFHSFLYWGWDKLAWIYFQANLYQVQFLVFNFLSYLILLITAPRLKQDKHSLSSFMAIFSIGFHLFLARGCFKYYDPFFITFIVIALGDWNLSFKRKYIGIPIFLIFIGWIIYANFLIIIMIKWLHQVLVLSLFISMILTLKLPFWKTLFSKNNFTELIEYNKETFSFIRRRKRTPSISDGHEKDEINTQ